VSAYRTAEERFAELPDFPYRPRYLEWEGLRLHYLDEGDGPAVMLCHGEPTWSFLYRKVAAVLLDAGFRVVAADQPGFGRSDKPTDPAFYTYDRHTAAAAAVAEHLDLHGATVVVQDWGGPIGLRIAVDLPARFSRLVLLNTALFTGTDAPSPGFLAWRAFAERAPDLPVRSIMRRSMVKPWPDDVLDAYAAPFPEPAAKVGAHRFPLIVPLRPDDEGAAEMRRVAGALQDRHEPALVLFSTDDPIFATSVGERFTRLIPGAGPLQTITGAGHFLQEDRGTEVGRRIAGFLRETG
jgi:haloalkane dehalogenase